MSFTVYAERDDTWNVRTNPIGWVIGPNLRLDTRLSEQWAFGVGGFYLDHTIRAVKMKGTSGEIFVTYYWSQVFESGGYVDMGLAYGDFRAEATDTVGQLASTQFGNLSAQMSLGYHWFWHPFNLALGAGVVSNSAAKKDIADNNGRVVDQVPLSGLGLATDASIGLSF